MPDARNLPGCSAAGSPAARGAEGGRRPAARRCPSMGSPESSGGGGPCAERGGGPKSRPSIICLPASRSLPDRCRCSPPRSPPPSRRPPLSLFFVLFFFFFCFCCFSSPQKSDGFQEQGVRACHGAVQGASPRLGAACGERAGGGENGRAAARAARGTERRGREV